MQQQLLPLHAPKTARFSDYIATDAVVIDSVSAFAKGEGPAFIWLWGAQASGKTHLAYAVCTEVSRRAESMAYLPLRDISDPASQAGLINRQWVVLDDIDQFVGDAAWEQHWFALFNAKQEGMGGLLVTSRQPPNACEFAIADVASRFRAGLRIELVVLTDDQLSLWWDQQDERYGMRLSADIKNYVLRHCPRDLHWLSHFFERLNKASLVQKRKITIPFVKSVADATS